VPKTTCSTVKHNGISDSVLDADSSSTKSGRRPSVDTVSTYLSHESKDSELRTSQVFEMCISIKLHSLPMGIMCPCFPKTVSRSVVGTVLAC
jgi:hypothetical protein